MFYPRNISQSLSLSSPKSLRIIQPPSISFPFSRSLPFYISQSMDQSPNSSYGCPPEDSFKVLSLWSQSLLSLDLVFGSLSQYLSSLPRSPLCSIFFSFPSVPRTLFLLQFRSFVWFSAFSLFYFFFAGIFSLVSASASFSFILASHALFFLQFFSSLLFYCHLMCTSPALSFFQSPSCFSCSLCSSFFLFLRLVFCICGHVLVLCFFFCPLSFSSSLRLAPFIASGSLFLLFLLFLSASSPSCISGSLFLLCGRSFGAVLVCSASLSFYAACSRVLSVKLFCSVSSHFFLAVTSAFSAILCTWVHGYLSVCFSFFSARLCFFCFYLCVCASSACLTMFFLLYFFPATHAALLVFRVPVSAVSVVWPKVYVRACLRLAVFYFHVLSSFWCVG